MQIAPFGVSDPVLEEGRGGFNRIDLLRNRQGNPLDVGVLAHDRIFLNVSVSIHIGMSDRRFVLSLPMIGRFCQGHTFWLWQHMCFM